MRSIIFRHVGRRASIGFYDPVERPRTVLSRADSVIWLYFSDMHGDVADGTQVVTVVLTVGHTRRYASDYPVTHGRSGGCEGEMNYACSRCEVAYELPREPRVK